MFFDLHNDFPTRFLNTDYCRYIGTTDGIITAVIFTTEFLRSSCKAVKSITERLMCACPLPIAIEDIGFLYSREGYRAFDFSKYFYCSLTWNYNNGFAGGALDDGCLTRHGKKVIRLIEQSGCYIDLAHLNRKSFFQVADFAQNVICSHTGFNGHPRSLNDEQIRLLIERRAVIGLCTVRKFSGAHTARRFADVIDGFVQKYGCDCLALGTDFNGSDDIPDDINDYKKLSDVQNLLYNRGYDRTTINKIFFENANNLYKKG